MLAIRALTRKLIAMVDVYLNIHALPGRFLFKMMNLNLISKGTRPAEHKYMHIQQPPPSLINVLVTVLDAVIS